MLRSTLQSNVKYATLPPSLSSSNCDAIMTSNGVGRGEGGREAGNGTKISTVQLDVNIER